MPAKASVRYPFRHNLHNLTYQQWVLEPCLAITGRLSVNRNRFQMLARPGFKPDPSATVDSGGSYDALSSIDTGFTPTTDCSSVTDYSSGSDDMSV